MSPDAVVEPLIALGAAGAVWALNAKVSSAVAKRLEGYVSKGEFSSYQEAHQRWGDEVLRELRHRMERIESQRDELTTLLRGINDTNSLARETLDQLRKRNGD